MHTFMLPCVYMSDKKGWKNAEQATDISLGHGSGGGNSEERNTEKKWPRTSSFCVLLWAYSTSAIRKIFS